MVRTRKSVGVAVAIGALLFVAQAPAYAAVTWHQIPSANTANSNFNTLGSANAVSAGEAWGVGFTRSVGATLFRPLAEHWTTAGGWQLAVSAPVPVDVDARLMDVASIATTNVWAVGQIFSTTFVPQGLIEHWTGSSWQRVASPAAEPVNAMLTALSTRSANDIWAVGSTKLATGNNAALIEHFNGSVWSVVPAASITGDTRLTDVTALSASDAWAVGVTNERPIAEHWNGTAWSQVALPALAGDGSLQGVLGVSAADVWAVGDQGGRALAMHWNGSAWSIVPTPTVLNTTTVLTDLTAIAANDVWAVGTSIQNGVTGAPVTEHWDGTAWTIVSSPIVVGAFGTSLSGVTGRPGGPLLAVGDTHGQDGLYRTFAIQG